VLSGDKPSTKPDNINAALWQNSPESTNAITDGAKQKPNEELVIGLVVSVALALALIVMPTLFYLFPENTARDRQEVLNARRLIIKEALYYGAEHSNPRNNLLAGVNLIEQEGDDGQPFYIGELEPWLSKNLGLFVDLYNADPSTLYPVTEEEVRYGLTEGLFETVNTGENESSYRLRVFFSWVNYSFWKGDIIGS